MSIISASVTSWGRSFQSVSLLFMLLSAVVVMVTVTFSTLMLPLLVIAVSAMWC